MMAWNEWMNEGSALELHTEWDGLGWAGLSWADERKKGNGCDAMLCDADAWIDNTYIDYGVQCSTVQLRICRFLPLLSSFFWAKWMWDGGT